MSEWKHVEGEDIIAQIRNSPDSIKRQAALVLLKNGAKPRHIRKKLDLSDRQLKVVQRLWKQVDTLEKEIL